MGSLRLTGGDRPEQVVVMSLPDSWIAFWSASVEWALLVWLFLLGAVVGSFVNVVVYRLPRGMSLVRPASRCPACGVPIALRDNLPIVGWLLLGGRCRVCRQPISPRYPLVELLLAIVFVLLAWYGPMSGELRVQGSGFRIQDSQLVAQGAEHAPSPPSVADNARPMSVREVWGEYAYHLCLLCSLVAASLTEFDGQRFAARLVLPALAIGFFAPLVWPHLRPVESGLLPGAAHAGRLDALAGGVTGLTVGLALGWVVTAVSARAPQSELSSQCPGKWQFSIALVWVGVFLGWQATAALAVAATFTWLLASLAARPVASSRRISPVFCLAPWTLCWILNWRTIVNHAPWLGANANVWILLAGSAVGTALARLIRLARPVQTTPPVEESKDAPIAE